MKRIYAKKSANFTKFELRQIVLILKLFIEINNFYKISYKYTIKTQKLLLPFISSNFYTKTAWKCDQNTNLRQYTVCLEHQIYASQENFTQPLSVMVETLRRSALRISFQKRPLSPFGPMSKRKLFFSLWNRPFYCLFCCADFKTVFALKIGPILVIRNKIWHPPPPIIITTVKLSKRLILENKNCFEISALKQTIKRAVP